jgi:ribosomal-protein-alanine N-acetyltransferase
MTTRHDQVDAIMAVMECAFDPAYGEAWNRRQVSDALIMPRTRAIVIDDAGDETCDPARAAAFAMSRFVLDEQELLLIAVRPQLRRRGLAQILMDRLAQQACSDNVKRLFLEMREGNPAEQLYLRCGFAPIGRRPSYYRGPRNTRLDAITFARDIP